MAALTMKVTKVLTQFVGFPSWSDLNEQIVNHRPLVCFRGETLSQLNEVVKEVSEKVRPLCDLFLHNQSSQSKRSSCSLLLVQVFTDL